MKQWWGYHQSIRLRTRITRQRGRKDLNQYGVWAVGRVFLAALPWVVLDSKIHYSSNKGSIPMPTMNFKGRQRIPAMIILDQRVNATRESRKCKHLAQRSNLKQIESAAGQTHLIAGLQVLPKVFTIIFTRKDRTIPIENLMHFQG